MPHSYHVETTHQLGRAVHGDPEERQENRRIWYLGGQYLFYLLTYLFETWYVNQEGLNFPGAYLPAPVLSAYVKASASTPRLTSWFDLFIYYWRGCIPEWVWRLKDNLMELVPSSYLCHLKTEFRVPELCGGWLYPLNFLALFLFCFILVLLFWSF